MTTPEARLAAAGHPPLAYREPASRYLPCYRVGPLLYFSGQLSAMAYDGVVEGVVGKMGREQDLDGGRAAARRCALGVLARAKVALGELGRVRHVVRMTGYINSTPDFESHHLVLDAASDIFHEAFGDAGRHTRLAIGVPGISFNATVEIDCIFEVEAT